MNIIKFSNFVILMHYFSAIICSEWNYQGLGPDVWIHEFPSCAGKLQSPINIETSKAIFDPKLGQIHYHNYDKLLYWNISNNGHTIMISQIGNDSLRPYITGSDFEPRSKYYLTQLHFHWGFNIYQGSEHHVNGQKFPLEVHLVHVSDTNKTSVLAFLFQISEKNNSNISGLIDKVGLDVDEKDFDLASFQLNSIIPDEGNLKTDGFYRYLGSLTTPPCTEGVKWTIFRTKINISENQIKEFYQNQIIFNDRDVQQLYNRTLKISIMNKNESNTSTRNVFNYLFIIVFLNFYFLKP
ncbi:unnamed protein product [Brachionus calyciflorus]|uniref:Carbonic anhydrase n=1 Tax=Brachionus calyciflorus TaxID=104777 RepID=A0A814N664_9BILA|nr:unnamed protein product [Brachionus calyciflorus]